jgi:hypothetical protein
MALVMDITRLKIIKNRAIKTTGTLIVIIASVPSGRIHPHIVIFRGFFLYIIRRNTVNKAFWF